jgi:chemotaxis protein methyltransferase CheR
MIRWFEEHDGGWRAVEPLRRLVRFQVHNLLEPAPHPGQFDIVLCRNVLLYLNADKRRAAFDRLASAMAPDGWLMLGAGETVIGQTKRLKTDPQARGLYRPSDSAAALPPRQRAAQGG